MWERAAARGDVDDPRGVEVVVVVAVDIIGALSPLFPPPGQSQASPVGRDAGVFDIEVERRVETEDAGRGRAGRGLLLLLLMVLLLYLAEVDDGERRRTFGFSSFDAIDCTRRQSLASLSASLPSQSLPLSRCTSSHLAVQQQLVADVTAGDPAVGADDVEAPVGIGGDGAAGAWREEPSVVAAAPAEAARIG